MKVICIDDDFKPNEVPESKWIKYGITYEIEEAFIFPFQFNLLGVKLKEIDNSNLAPYCYFDIRRFQPTEETIIKAMVEGTSIPIDEKNGLLKIKTKINNTGKLAV